MPSATTRSPAPASASHTGVPVAGRVPTSCGADAGAVGAAAVSNGHTPLVKRSTENPPLPSVCQISPRSGTNAGASIAYDDGSSPGIVGSLGWFQYAISFGRSGSRMSNTRRPERIIPHATMPGSSSCGMLQ